MMGTTALGYLAAWGPFAGLCIWEMVAEPQVELLFISFLNQMYDYLCAGNTC